MAKYQAHCPACKKVFEGTKEEWCQRLLQAEQQVFGAFYCAECLARNAEITYEEAMTTALGENESQLSKHRRLRMFGF